MVCQHSRCWLLLVAVPVPSHTPDTPELRKARGAFFTPPAIADYLADWAVEGDPTARVIDPTCGESVFLLAAGRKLAELGVSAEAMRDQVVGVDLHKWSVDESARLLEAEGLAGSFHVGDFFGFSPPNRTNSEIGAVDAVIGNQQRMAEETAALLNTYLDGAGVLAWKERASRDGYEIVPMPSSPKVADLDDALWRISSHIEKAVKDGDHLTVPTTTGPVAPEKLLPDT